MTTGTERGTGDETERGTEAAIQSFNEEEKGTETSIGTETSTGTETATGTEKGIVFGTKIKTKKRIGKNYL